MRLDDCQRRKFDGKVSDGGLFHDDAAHRQCRADADSSVRQDLASLSLPETDDAARHSDFDQNRENSRALSAVDESPFKRLFERARNGLDEDHHVLARNRRRRSNRLSRSACQQSFQKIPARLGHFQTILYLRKKGQLRKDNFGIIANFLKLIFF